MSKDESSSRNSSGKCESCGYVESHDANCPRPRHAEAEAWAERHDIDLKGADLIAAFDDARTVRSERGPSAEAARIARKVLDEKGLYNITTEEMVLAREILRLASPAERDDELKPCPCCGGKASIGNSEPDGSGGYFVECDDCGVTTPLIYNMMGTVRRELLDKWNRRVVRPESGRIEVEEQWGRQQRIELLELALEQYAMRPGKDGEIARIALNGKAPVSARPLPCDASMRVAEKLEDGWKEIAAFFQERNWPDTKLGNAASTIDWNMPVILNLLRTGAVSTTQPISKEK